MNELALFAGVGGGVLGGKLLGWRTVCAVERDAYCAAVLAQRQNDGCLEPFPIWSDVETFDGRPWRGIVDVVSGGFPCQDISCAGKGAGIDGARSGLWKQMARIIGEVRPRYVFVENTPPLVRRGLARVLGDLAQMGYDARWGVFSACEHGLPHTRERLFIVAHPNGPGRQESLRVSGQKAEIKVRPVTWPFDWKHDRLAQEVIRFSINDRSVDAFTRGMDRRRTLGNAQIPIVAATAWNILTED